MWGSNSDDAVLASGEGGQVKVDPEQSVYITRTGTKYHRAGCRSLARSQIPIALKNVGNYGPCGIRRPPVLTTTTAKTPDVVQAAPRAPYVRVLGPTCQSCSMGYRQQILVLSA